MKILMVNKFLYPKGGAETYVIQLGRYLESTGHQVQYFGMQHEENCIGNFANSYTSNMDFHSHSVNTITYPMKIIYSIEARRKIRAVLNDFQPDVVHLNNFNFQLTPSIIYEIRSFEKDTGKKTKIIFTAHDYQLVCPNHLLNVPSTLQNCEECIDGNFGGCVRQNCIHSSKLKSIIGAAEGMLYKKLNTYEKIDSVICCSNFLKTKLDHNNCLKNKTIAIHNFTEPNNLVTGKSDYVLYFGRYAEEKGIRFLMECIKQLPKIRFVFAGSGPLEEELRQRKNIENVGFKTGDELKSLIAGARFSIYPSIWYENCPFSVMESISLSTPVIASRIGGIPELIEDGKTGILLPISDQKAWCETIHELFFDKKRCKEMSENCMSAKFDAIKDYTDKLLKIYTQVK